MQVMQCKQVYGSEMMEKPASWAARVRRVGIIVVMVLVWGWGGVVFAETAPSLDELLGLPGAQTSEADKSTNKDTDTSSNDAGEQATMGEGVNAKVKAKASGAKSSGGEDQPEVVLSPEESADLFTRALREMDQTALMLSQEMDASLPTQRKQQEVLTMLDQIIASAKQQQSSGGGGGSSSDSSRNQDRGGQQPAGSQGSTAQSQGSGLSQASGENSGQASPGSVGASIEDTGEMLESRDQWGDLPPRLREQLLQGFAERFSSVYEDMTAAYYERLAQDPEP